MNIGRNLPCPCGSGRKYKRCCLARESVRAAATTDHGPGVALTWIHKRFKDQIKEAMQSGFFAGIDLEESSDALGALSRDVLGMLEINISDFMLCDAVYDEDGEEARGIDWVLEKCPRLSATQRDYLLALAEAPLRLYEVMAVEPGVGLELRDLIDPARSPEFVRERTATLTLSPGYVLGARVVHLIEHRELSGVLYPLPPMVGLEIIDRVQRELAEEDEDDALFDTDPDDDDELDDEPTDELADAPTATEVDAIEAEIDQAWDDVIRPLLAKRPKLMAELSEAIAEDFGRHGSPEVEELEAALAAEMEDDVAAAAIREAWLRSVLFTRVQQMVDRASGETICLVEDDYDVRDPTALAAELAACGDVTGDAAGGWSRLEDPGAEMSSVLTAINTTDSPDRVTLFHRTRGTADAGREWFESIVGANATRRARRVTDPREMLAGGATVAPFTGAKSAARAPATPEFSPEQMSAIMEQVLRRTYANWCDEPVPALDHKTPRQCLEDDAGRERVRFLLRSYEHDEQCMAAEMRRAPVSYKFLWAALPLSREE